jgi:hypothetical protein
LKEHGIDFSSNRILVENAKYTDDLLQLEPFDDSEFEKRTPTDYLA